MRSVKEDAIIESKSSPYPLSRLSARFEPLDKIQELEQAKKMLGVVAHGKLSIIAEQIKLLQEKAKNIILQAEADMDLHQANCAFEKRVGKTYYLYKRSEEECYFSMLSLEDWNNNPPHEFLGAYQLEPDMSWLKIEP